MIENNLLLVGCCLFVSIYGAQLTRADTPEVVACASSGCNMAASEMSHNMDGRANPCEDFYEFACGKFANHRPAGNQTSINGQVISRTLISDRIRKHLELDEATNLAEKTQDGLAMQKLRLVYQQCLLSAANLSLSVKRQLLRLIESLGGWPLLPSNGRQVGSEKEPLRWEKILELMRSNGLSFNMFFSVQVMPDLSKPSQHVVHIGAPDDNPPLIKYFVKAPLISTAKSDPKTRAYYDRSVAIATALGANADQVERDMDEVYEFMLQLLKISKGREDKYDNKWTMTELKSKATNTNWPQLLSLLLGIGEEYKDEMIVSEPKSLIEIDKLLFETDPRIVANFMILRAIEELMPLMSGELYQIQLEFESKVYKRAEPKPRWKTCMSQLETPSSGLAIASWYLRAYGHGHEEERKFDAAHEIAQQVKEEFELWVRGSDLIDETTKVRLINKIEDLVVTVDFPPEMLDVDLIDSQYKDLDIDERKDFLTNFRSLQTWKASNSFAALKIPNERAGWRKFGNFVVGESGYNSIDNWIMIAQELQLNFYLQPDRPMYINFATFGSIVGHELIHVLFDAEQADSIWSPQSMSKLEDKTKCFVDQYRALRLDATRTLEENICDNHGLALAFGAYKSWLAKEPQRAEEELRLPRLDMDTEQLFWMSYANMWCESNSNQPPKYTDHSPNKFRVIGSLANRAEFSRSFQCQTGSPMNPAKKCSLWE